MLELRIGTKPTVVVTSRPDEPEPPEPERIEVEDLNLKAERRAKQKAATRFQAPGKSLIKRHFQRPLWEPFGATKWGDRTWWWRNTPTTAVGRSEEVVPTRRRSRDMVSGAHMPFMVLLS